MSTYTVYKHTSPAGKVYIGITAREPSQRWHGGSAYRNNTHFYAAIQKYGWDSFAHEILATGLTREAAAEMEIRLIAEYDSTNPAKGYNVSRGGDRTTLGYHYTEEQKRHISEALKGKRKGVAHTPEHAQAIAEALKGRPYSEHTRQKLREALGDRFSNPTAREKQKQNTPRGAGHPKARAVLCKDTGRIYPTIDTAAKAVGVGRTAVSACCRGLQKTAGGHRWEYIDRRMTE